MTRLQHEVIAATTLQRTERERSSALPPASASCALHWLLTAGPAAAALVPPPPAAPTVTTACKPHDELGVGPTSPGPYVKGGRCGRRCASGCRCVCSCCCRSTIAVISGFTLFLAIMSVAAYDPLAVQWHRRHSTIRGTNVGGWLLAERWLVGAYETATDTTCCSGVPNPYNHSTVDCRTMKPPIDPQAGANLTCQDDERAASVWRRANGTVDQILQFRDEWITRQDFVIMAQRGINSIRIPIGHWVVHPSPPYIYGRGLGYIDDAVRWSKEFGQTVLLDLHGAVGSQNGKQTSGLEDWAWTSADFDVNATLEVLRTLASRYANESHVIGIELINEPELPVEVLLDFYRRASDIIRLHMPPERVAVVINLFYIYEVFTIAWHSMNWNLPASRYPNLVYDLHFYYTFAAKGAPWVSVYFWTSTIFIEIQSALLSIVGRPALVGEWSLAIPSKNGTLPFRQMAAMSEAERHELRTKFAARQVRAITRGSRVGGYFWTWIAPLAKTAWSCQDAYEDGFFPPGLWSAPPPPPYGT